MRQGGCLTAAATRTHAIFTTRFRTVTMMARAPVRTIAPNIASGRKGYGRSVCRRTGRRGRGSSLHADVRAAAGVEEVRRRTVFALAGCCGATLAPFELGPAAHEHIISIKERYHNFNDTFAGSADTFAVPSADVTLRD